MDTLRAIKGRLTDVRDQSALESALYHLPTVFAKDTHPAVKVSFAAVSIRDVSCLLSSPTLHLSHLEVSKTTDLVRRLTRLINSTVGSIRSHKRRTRKHRL